MIESVVTWKWRAREGYRSTFTARHVNVLKSMVDRNYPRPYRFICVTDDAEGLDPCVEVVDIRTLYSNQWSHIPNPSWRNGPSCYRRLELFGPRAGELFGRRFVSIDLDVVVTGDLTRIWDRTEPIVLWSDPLFNPRGMYCGSMILMDAGAAPAVYSDFSPKTSPAASRASGCAGSDQGWIAHKLGKGMPAWTTRDGVYSYWVHIEKRGPALPRDARIVIFHGNTDPWSEKAQTLPWVRQHWR